MWMKFDGYQAELRYTRKLLSNPRWAPYSIDEWEHEIGRYRKKAINCILSLI
jgi:hypothetical protein